MWFLNQKGIQCGVHYPIPIHLQKAYQTLGYPSGSFPIAEKLAQELISLPMFPEMTEQQLNMVTFAIKDAVLTAALV